MIIMIIASCWSQGRIFSDLKIRRTHVDLIFYPNCNVLFQFALVHPDFRSVDVETQVKALEVPMDLVEAFLGGAMGDPKPKLLNFL